MSSILLKYCSSYLHFFCLLVLSVTERRVLKSQTKFLDIFLFSFSAECLPNLLVYTDRKVSKYNLCMTATFSKSAFLLIISLSPVTFKIFPVLKFTFMGMNVVTWALLLTFSLNAFSVLLLFIYLSHCVERALHLTGLDILRSWILKIKNANLCNWIGDFRQFSCCNY
jgi:hypothetical protein